MKIKTNSGDFETKIETKWGMFDLLSTEKVIRVIDGEPNAEGVFQGGLGIDAKPEEIIVLYDKKAGLIKGKEGAAVKTGSFYNFQAKKPQKQPEVTYIFRINNRNVEYKEGDAKPLEIQAAEMQAKADAKANLKANDE